MNDHSLKKERLQIMIIVAFGFMFAIVFNFSVMLEKLGRGRPKSEVIFFAIATILSVVAFIVVYPILCNYFK